MLSTIHRFFLAKILICSYFFFSVLISSNDIHFKSIRTSSTTMKIWDIRKLASTLGLDACHIMPFVQAITGCDTISNIWNGSAAFQKVLNEIRLMDDDVHESIRRGSPDARGAT